MPQGAGIALFGDWGKAKEILGTLAQRFKKAADQAMLQEAEFLRGELIKYIREGPLLPLSPKTIAIRRFGSARDRRRFKGTRPLTRAGDLRNSIRVHKTPDGILVGILKSAKGKDGQKLINVAQLMEFGSKPFVIHVTKKSSAYYHAALAAAGIQLPAHGHGGGGYPIVIVRIPPRPVFRPVFEKYGKPNDLRARIAERLAKLLTTS